MKLLFPNGEHAPVEMDSGRVVLGSANDVDIVLMTPGIAPRHAEIEFAAVAAKISVTHPDNPVTVNGKPVTAPADVKPGDLITFGSVRARATAVEKAASAPPSRPKPVDVDDDGRTKVRMALPKFVLRGVSGVTFGKIFPLQSSAVIGRQSECEISIPSEEVSRRHAELRVTPDGVMVEDLGSSNGTYVNDRRITRQLMKAGDELRLDTIRFLLLAPGQEMGTPAVRNDAPTVKTSTARGKSGRMGLMWAFLVIAALTLGVLVARLTGVF
ncbi:MAG: FHA domain-containing protein [Xanthomonadales bacterium]|nr:hypothetical protein [Xanthomonadales bacterium]MCC6593859.1 FHA domain-containing protein [Xanthomonadales bacterium]MCE7929933.1 FHA domain-containing protein [Xanthomonadales bacterium PRO6]